MGNDELKDRYVHGYQLTEQQRLVSQAEFWRDSLILDGPPLAPGTRLLEIGCGVGAVLGTLGTTYPGVHLTGVDIEPDQIAFAQAHLVSLDVRADLRVADGRRLPYEDGTFDHVWMMWVLEHMSEEDAVAVLREARRVLVPGGTITAIEGDYRTLKVASKSAPIESLLSTLVLAMQTYGQADAGSQLWGWLDEVGFTGIEPGARLFSYRGGEVGPSAHYVADVVETSIGALAAVPGGASEETLRQGLQELRELDSDPGARMRYVANRAQARA
jgi:ubiquinone/menaquinone biosynthesis C-methylase UbiE